MLSVFFLRWSKITFQSFRRLVTPRLRVQTKLIFFQSACDGKNTVKIIFCFANQKAPMEDGNVSKVVFVSGSKSTNFVSKNRSRIRTWLIMIVAVVLFFGAVLSAVLMRKTKEKTNYSRSVTEVNLEEGEMLTYRVEQRLEIRGGDVQKGI